MTIPVGVGLIYDGTHASIPTNWSRMTAFDDRFVLSPTTSGDGGTNGGQSTHDHAITSHTHTVSAGAASGTITTNFVVRGRTPTSVLNHTHASAASNGTTANTGTASNDPPYYEVIWITPTSTPQDVPAGVIGFFNGVPPTGWSVYNSLKGYFPKGAGTGADAGTTGGSSDSHTHTCSHSHSAKNSAISSGRTFNNAGTSSVAGYVHTHSVTLSSSSATFSNGDAMPPFRTLYPASSASANTPVGIIGIWDGTNASIPTNWLRVTAQDDNFLSSDEGLSTGGADTHNHNSGAAHTHSYSAGNGAIVNVTTGVASASAYNHTHTWSIGTSSPATGNNTSKSNYPLYRTAIMVEFQGTPSAGFGQQAFVY